MASPARPDPLTPPQRTLLEALLAAQKAEAMLSMEEYWHLASYGLVSGAHPALRLTGKGFEILASLGA